MTVRCFPAAVSLRAVLEQLDDGLRGPRDRALLLVGFAGALRRSELVGLDVDDLERIRVAWCCTSGAARRIRPAPAVWWASPQDMRY